MNTGVKEMNEINMNETIQSVQPVQNVQPMQKPKKEYSAKETAFAMIAVVMGFLVIKLFAAPFAVDAALGLGASVLLMLLTVYACLWTKQKSRSHTIRMILCFMFSLNVFISSNSFLQFLDVVFVGLTLLYDRLAVSDGIERIKKTFSADLFSAVFVRPFSCFADAPDAVAHRFRNDNTAKNGINVIVGILIALPSTFIVAVLLSRVDSGFGDIVSAVFDNFAENALTVFVQFVFGIPVGFYIFGSCYSSQYHKSEITTDRSSALMIVPAMMGFFSAVPVCVLYVVFFFSQLNHYISAFMNKLPDQETYSSYARDGFFELCAVAVINLMILVFLNVFCKHGENGRAKSIKSMTFTLCVFTIMLIATAISKMLLYIDVYGLTILRTYTTWFMVLLAVVFVTAAVQVFADKVNIPRVVVTVFTVMFAMLSFCNVDGLIAEYNIGRYESGTLNRLAIDDYKYISSGAYPALRKAWENGDFKGSDSAEAMSMLSTEQRSGDIRTITVMDIYSDIMCAGRNW